MPLCAKQVPGRTCSSVRSRRRMSSRVLQPLWPNSTLTSSLQGSPKLARLKSWKRSQPLTGNVVGRARGELLRLGFPAPEVADVDPPDTGGDHQDDHQGQPVPPP